MRSASPGQGPGEPPSATHDSPEAHLRSDAAAFADGGHAVADLLARAFRDNPMNVAVLRRSPEARVRANRLGARLLLRTARAAGHVLVADDDRGCPLGALIGFGPRRAAAPPATLAHAVLLLRQGLRAALRWGRVQSELGGIRPVEPHWTLAMVGVDPERQGRGEGSALVERWVARIADEPAPAWVETDRPELVAFYRRFGFEPRARRRVYGVEAIGLWREAP